MHRPMMAPGADKGRREAKHHKMREARHKKQRAQGLAADRMLRHSEALELTEEQVTRLKTLSYETKKDLIDLKADLAKQKLELKKLIDSETDDLTRLRRQIEAMAKKKAELHVAKLANRIEARKVLTDDQRAKTKKKRRHHRREI